MDLGVSSESWTSTPRERVWKPVVCGAPGSAEGRRLCLLWEDGLFRTSLAHLIRAGASSVIITHGTSTEALELGSWTSELRHEQEKNRNASRIKLYKYKERDGQGSEGREGRGKRGRERVSEADKTDWRMCLTFYVVHGVSNLLPYTVCYWQACNYSCISRKKNFFKITFNFLQGLVNIYRVQKHTQRLLCHPQLVGLLFVTPGLQVEALPVCLLFCVYIYIYNVYI